MTAGKQSEIHKSLWFFPAFPSPLSQSDRKGMDLSMQESIETLHIFLAAVGIMCMMFFVTLTVWLAKRKQRLEHRLQEMLKQAARTVSEHKPPTRLGSMCPCSDCPFMEQAMDALRDRTEQGAG